MAEYLLTHGADPNKLSTVLLFNEWDSFEDGGLVIRHFTPLVMAFEKDVYNEHALQLIQMLIHFGANPYDTTSNDTSGGIIPNVTQKLMAFANDRNGYSEEWTSIINLIDLFTTLGLLDQNLTSSPTKV